MKASQIVTRNVLGTSSWKFRTEPIVLFTLAMTDLTYMSSVNLEPIIGHKSFWEWNTIGKYFGMASLGVFFTLKWPVTYSFEITAKIIGYSYGFLM